jgi:hypothetical protein
MKRLVEVNNEGLEKLIGSQVLLLCSSYFYTGKLIGVNKKFVLLQDPSIVYDTGGFDKQGYVDAQRLHTKEFYVMINAIEAFGLSK